jgi:hypothetical protein
MTTNPALLHDYQEVLKKWEKLRYIEQVRDENPERMNTWYEQGRVVIYRYRVHLFGKCDSPCLAMAANFLQALKHKDQFPEAFETIANASLVDDMADLRPKKTETQELIQQLIEFFPTCAMDILKFVGNKFSLINDLKPEQRIKDLQDTQVFKYIFEGKRPLSKVKVLGLLWNYRDIIGFDFTDVERPISLITKIKGSQCPEKVRLITKRNCTCLLMLHKMCIQQ